MKKSNRKGILLALAFLVVICASGATWAVLKDIVEFPVHNFFNAAVEYRLTYHLNGGTGDIAQDVYYDKADGVSHIFEITTQQPTLENYMFLGWADTEDATTATYTAGASVTVSKASPQKTVYAVWGAVEEINQFRLEFNANIPEGVAASVAVPTPVEMEAPGELYTFKVSNALAKDYNVDNTGLRFVGWSTSEFGDVVFACNEEKPNISVTGSVGTTVLYAVWEFDYYITFSRNASDNSVTKHHRETESYVDDMTDITVKVDYDAIVVASTYMSSGYLYRRADHMLVGFSLSQNGKEAMQSVTIPKAGKNNALVVYAIWESGSFALVYDASGGKSAPSAEIKITTAKTYTFTVTSEQPVAADTAEARFLGWSDDPDATQPDQAYAAGNTVTLTEDYPSMTLYAVWEYTYRLNFNAGHASGDVPTEIVIGPTTDKYVTITVPSDPIPIRDQYEFDYWAAAEDRVSGEHRYYDVANYSRTITLRADDTNVTMYARMKPTNGVTLNYSNNNGNNTWNKQTMNDNTQDFCTFTIPSSTPTRENYSFLGWAETSSAVKPTLFAGDTVKVDADENASKTIYAVWKRYDRMRVNINFNGGSYTKGSGCNEETFRERTGSYEWLKPGATVHDFEMVTFEKNGLTNLYFPTRSGYSVAGFAYVNDEGRLTTAISMQDSSLCSSGGVKGFRWSAASQAAGTQEVITVTENPDGSKDYTLRSYIIWAKNAAYDKYEVRVNKNYNDSTTFSSLASQSVKQVEKEASGNTPAVINTSYSFAPSKFDLSSLAYGRNGYKMLGFARTSNATTPEWAVSGSTLQSNITVRQDDPDVVFNSTGGSDGGASYTLNLYSVWERQQIYKLYADFGIGSYSIYNSSSETTTVYDDYTWSSQQSLSTTFCSWSSPAMGGTPSRLGFKFLGFATDPNATVPEYTVSGNAISPSITVSQDDPKVVKTTTSDNVDIWTLNLYGIYAKEQLFKLTLDFNGGTSSSQTERTLTRQEPLTTTQCQISSTGFSYPSRYGYQFVGFATTPNATVAEYTMNSSGVISPGVDFDTSTLTPTINSDGVAVYTKKLYAVWQEVREYQVNVDANGGSFASNATISSTKTVSMATTSVTWSANTMTIGTPTKANFRFLGYAYTTDAKVPNFTVSGGKLVEELTMSETGNYVVNDTSSVPNRCTLTLYAVWEPMKYYRLNFELGEGKFTNSSGTTTSQLQLTSAGQDITGSSYTFTNPSYSAKGSVYRNGFYHYGYTDVQNSTTSIIGTPTMSGSSSPYTYTFNGSIIVTEGTAGVVTEVLDNGVTYVTKTLYPIWGIRLFYYNGSNLPANVVRYNSAANNRVFDISSMIPTKQNFQFAGWATNSTTMIPEYGISGYVSSSTEPLATQYTLSSSNDTGYLYAVWWQRYTISYSANGGLENTTPTRESAYATLNYTSSSTTHTFEVGRNVPVYDENNSREFLGWSTDPNATTGTYMPGADVVIQGNSDGSETTTVLYAIWGPATE